MKRRVWRTYTAMVWLALAGCQSRKTQSPEGSSAAGEHLPAVPSGSVALPDAVNAADAPKAPSVAEPSTDNLVTYRDAVHGVSFAYPSVWRPAAAGSTYLASPEFAEMAPKPFITEAFSPKDNLYADTVLSGLSFSYTVKPRSTAAACAALSGKALLDPMETRQATYGGRLYTEGKGGDAGMCHQLEATVDTTLQGTSCYLFERDTMTRCPYTETQSRPRPLTKSEETALQRHLDAVMQSVRIAATAAKTP